MKTKIFLSSTFILFIILSGCNENTDGIDDIVANPNKTQIEYVSFQSLGCQGSNKAPTINDWATIEWSYFNNNLNISTLFTTHCSAIMKDSVLATEDKIEVYLRDTNNRGARCICKHKEIFDFYAESPKTIEFVLFYKGYANEDFIEMCRRTIKI